MTLQYSYLFGILPALMIGAVDDILIHVKRIGPVLRMLLVGAVAFFAAELMYGSRGPDSGVVQFILYGLVGFIPARSRPGWRTSSSRNRKARRRPPRRQNRSGGFFDPPRSCVT